MTIKLQKKIKHPKTKVKIASKLISNSHIKDRTLTICHEDFCYALDMDIEEFQALCLAIEDKQEG